MTNLRLRNRVLLGALASAFIGLSSVSGVVLAGGTAFDADNISGMGSAGAGQAAEASDASVIFYNPAALTRFKQAELTQGAVFTTVEHSYTSLQNNDGAPTNSGSQGSAGQTFDRNPNGYDASALAPHTYVVIPLSPKTVMGFSASASQALLLHYDSQFPGRNQGKDIDLKVTRLNLGVGHKLTPTLSIGVNGSYERYFQNAKVALNYREAVRALAGNAGVAALDAGAATGQTPAIPQEATAVIRLFGYAFNAQLGALWEPSDRTRVGISYRPKPKFNGNEGTFTINENPDGAAFRQFLSTPTAATILPTAPQSAADLNPYQRANQNITLNDELRLSIFHHTTPKLDLMATYTREDFRDATLKYTRDNGRTIEDIPQNFQVTQSYRIGANYKMYRRLIVRAGYAYETSAIDDATRITILPDNNRRYYAVGATYLVDPNTDLHFAFQRFQIDPAVVGLNQSSQPPEVRGGQFYGITNTRINFFGVGLTQRF